MARADGGVTHASSRTPSVHRRILVTRFLARSCYTGIMIQMMHTNSACDDRELDELEVLTVFGMDCNAAEQAHRAVRAARAAKWDEAADRLSALWPKRHEFEDGFGGDADALDEADYRVGLWCSIATSCALSVTRGDYADIELLLKPCGNDVQWWVDTLLVPGADEFVGNYDSCYAVGLLRAGGFGVEKVDGGGGDYRWLILGRDHHQTTGEPSRDPSDWGFTLDVEHAGRTATVVDVGTPVTPLGTSGSPADGNTRIRHYEVRIPSGWFGWDYPDRPHLGHSRCACGDCGFGEERIVEDTNRLLQQILDQAGGALPPSLSCEDLHWGYRIS